jgi:hypothetical protein
MTRLGKYSAGALAIVGLLAGRTTGVAEGTDAVAPHPGTNAAPTAWSWTPTPEQEELADGKQFTTTADATRRVVRHRLANRSPMTPQETSTCTIDRAVAADGRAVATAQIMVYRALTEPACFFDELRPVVFVVDGVRFELPCDRARADTGKEDSAYGLSWRAKYSTLIGDPVLRALGKASAASVEVPCRRGAKWVHEFGPDELARFATYARVFMTQPTTEATRPKPQPGGITNSPPAQGATRLSGRQRVG